VEVFAIHHFLYQRLLKIYQLAYNMNNEQCGPTATTWGSHGGTAAIRGDICTIF